VQDLLVEPKINMQVKSLLSLQIYIDVWDLLFEPTNWHGGKGAACWARSL